VKSDAAMTVRFWGVRGSVPCPGPETVRYGGNTSCVEVRCGDHRIIFDAGTGLRPLGDAVLEAGGPFDADLFCSHTHWDHICGLGFFAPAYQTGVRLRLWGEGPGTGPDAFETAITASLSEPFLPNLRPLMGAALEFRSFHVGETLHPQPGVTLRTAALNHPGDATGYRLEWAGRALAYVTDTEHRPDALDPRVLELIQGADLMIYDATYTDVEFEALTGRGHSTWQEAVRLAKAAGVAWVALFHHDPAHSDEVLDAIAADVVSAGAPAVLAREGMILSL